jgi:aryl-alcohol dehydrogenase-like predicted oxidoreductase
MNLRPLGRSGLRVSEIGFGAWGIGAKQWIGAKDDDSLRALDRAVELGLNFVDTALAYGDGHSERLVGQALRRHKGLRVATKIPPKNRRWPARGETPVSEVFPGDYVRARTEESLRNLGVETIDLQQLHVWTDEFLTQGDWRESVQRLKSEGKIRHFGVSLGEHTPDNGLALVESGLVDSVQVIYNIFDPSPAERLFPLCRKLNVGVLARVPLDEGGLTGKITPETAFPDGDFRASYFRGERKAQVQERVKRLVDDLGIPPEALPELALRFCLSHPAVSSVIPGMRSLRNVEANCAVSDGRGLPPDVLQKLAAHAWPRNFYT